MIKDLAEFGFDDYWVDTSKVYAVRPIRREEDTDRKTGEVSVTYRCMINLAGDNQGFVVNEEDLEFLTRLRDFFVEEMMKRDVA